MSCPHSECEVNRPMQHPDSVAAAGSLRWGPEHGFVAGRSAGEKYLNSRGKPTYCKLGSLDRPPRKGKRSKWQVKRYSAKCCVDRLKRQPGAMRWTPPRLRHRVPDWKR